MPYVSEREKVGISLLGIVMVEHRDNKNWPSLDKGISQPIKCHCYSWHAGCFSEMSRTHTGIVFTY